MVWVSCIIIVKRGMYSPLFRTEFILMIGRMPNLPVQTQYLFLRTSTGDWTEIQIFRSIFVIKWPHRKVNQNIPSGLKLTSPLLISPYIFDVLRRDSWCARLSVFYSDLPDQELRVSLKWWCKNKAKKCREKVGGKSEHRLFSKVDADGRGG